MLSVLEGKGTHYDDLLKGASHEWTCWANGGDFSKKCYQGMMALPQQTLHSAEKREPNRRRKTQGCILGHYAFLTRDRVPHAGAT